MTNEASSVNVRCCGGSHVGVRLLGEGYRNSATMDYREGEQTT